MPWDAQMTKRLSGTVGCTIVARNYMSYAHVLADGWHRHHDGLPLVVLVIDDPDRPSDRDGVKVIAPSELGVPEAELSVMRGMYGIAELTTALKPHLLRHLLHAGADAVLYMDSDADVRGDLDEAAALASQHGVVLSGHFLVPPPLDGRSPSELDKLRSGIFNSGFLAVGPSAHPFLEWWSERLRRDCLFSDPLGLHADQGWLNLVPSYFDHVVSRDPGINVAPWNVHERPVRREGDAFTAAGAPLRMFHFAGFDPEYSRSHGSRAWPFLRFHEAIGASAPLRTDVSREPDLMALCGAYCEKLYAAGYLEHRATPYRFALAASGRPLDVLARRTYRELVLAAEARGEPDLVPDPFSRPRAREFESMIASPSRAGLLSGAALARLTDARLAHPVPAGRLHAPRMAIVLAKQLVRRAPGRRYGWAPHPLPSDRTGLEYSAAPEPIRAHVEVAR